MAEDGREPRLKGADRGGKAPPAGDFAEPERKSDAPDKNEAAAQTDPSKSVVQKKADAGGPKSQAPKEAASQHAKETAKAATGHMIRQHELIDRVRAYDPAVDERLLNRAYVFSMKAHGGQTRKSGDPYFVHPIAVAAILTD